MKKYISAIFKIACFACLCTGISSAQQASETATDNNDYKVINLKEKILYTINNYIPELAGNTELISLIQTEAPDAIEWDNSSTIANLIISDAQEDTYLHWKIYKDSSATSCLSLDIIAGEIITTKTITIDDDVLILEQLIPDFSSTITGNNAIQAERYVMLWVNFDAYLGDGAVLTAASDPNLQDWLEAVHNYVTNEYAKPNAYYGLIRLSEALTIVNADPGGAFYIVY
jgi:hypothetical protein